MNRSQSKLFEDTKLLVSEMISDDSDRDEMFEWMDDAFHSKWKLPKPLSDFQWVTKTVSTYPYRALTAGTWSMTTLEPILKVRPSSDTVGSAAWADKAERVLKWNFDGASRRRQSLVRADMMASALQYDAICATVMFLPYQAEALKALGSNGPRLDAIARFGPFVIDVLHPKSVHARWSSYLPETVAMVTEQTAYSIGKVYNNQELIDQGSTLVTVKDAWDYEYHTVWVEGTGDADTLNILPPTKHGLPFIPIVLRMGTRSWEKEPEKQYVPMLKPVYDAHQWDIDNVVQTLLVSGGLSEWAKPKVVVKGSGSEKVTVPFDEPGGVLPVAENISVTELAQSTMLSQALMQLAQQMESAMEGATIPRVLGGMEPPSGQAYASYNLQISTALNAIKPHTAKTELALADTATLMCLWSAYSDIPLEAMGMQKDDYGKGYKIYPEEINTEGLIIDVTLKPDMPTDRQAQVNTAVMMHRDLRIPAARIQEFLGFEDPSQLEREYIRELMTDTNLNMHITAKQARQQLLIQQEQMNMQMQAQAAMQQAQATEQPNPGTPPGAPPQLSGMQYNPAQGGEPPQEVAPDMTREGQMGMTRGGQGIV